MRIASLLLLSALTLGATELMSGGASSNDVYVNYSTQLEPGSPPMQEHGGGVLSDNNVIKRHLCNFDNRTYFGYDLVIQPLEGGRYSLSFAPLSITPEKMSQIFKKVPQWSLLALPKGPASVEVRAGETVALDLFVNPTTRQRVTDYLTVKGEGRQSVKVDGPARDFTPDDAEIHIDAPRISIDGKPLTSTKGGVSGQAVWIDLPGHGRFVFSLAPRTDLGMVRAGEIRGATMTWQTGSHQYSISSAKPITSGSNAFHLYVFHIPRAADFFGMSAGPKPDDPIRRR